MPGKPDNSLYLLGKYLGLASMLPSGAFAGYLLGKFGEHYLHWSALPAVCIVLGVIGGLIRLVQELLRDSQRSDRTEK